MQTLSNPVRSNQPHLHPKLTRVVERHLHTIDRTPVPQFSRDAYREVGQALGRHSHGLILDSFCGTGHSTALLAQHHPDHLVVGIDQSARRLQKHTTVDLDNYLLLRARCEDIWRLLVSDGITLEYHYLFYPNPWPKACHLQRRVHGHASFPLLTRLGGVLELRSNWQLYVEEFGLAMQLAGQTGYVGTVPGNEPPLSLFEQKYRESGHPLWRYTCAIVR